MCVCSSSDGDFKSDDLAALVIEDALQGAGDGPVGEEIVLWI